MNNGARVLGLDIRGVIIERLSRGNDPWYEEGGFLSAKPFSGALETIPRLVERFEGRVYLVSRCVDKEEVDRTLSWLERHDFCAKTGIPLERVRFCETRELKAKECQECGITHFVDDRLEVLGYLDGVVANRYLFCPRWDEVDTHYRHLGKVTRVFKTWQEAETHIL